MTRYIGRRAYEPLRVRLVPTWRSRLWLTLALVSNWLRLEGLTALLALRGVRAMREDVVR